jgi:hypothetical protein
MKTKIWATFGVSVFLMFFFSYALVAAGKKVYEQNKELPEYIFIQARFAYISQKEGTQEKHFTLSAVSPLALGYREQGMRNALVVPLEKILQDLKDKNIDAQLVYYNLKSSDSQEISLKNPTYNPYKEEITFIIESSSLKLNERYSEPVLAYKADELTKKRFFFFD